MLFFFLSSGGIKRTYLLQVFDVTTRPAGGRVRNSSCAMLRRLSVWCEILTLAAFLFPASVRASSGGLMRGSPISCDTEGAPVEVPWISNDPCISCKCQNKEVVCQKEVCPRSKSCYFLLYGQEKKSCCDACKGCSYKGSIYYNGDEWTDPDDPCLQLTCESGVVTETRVECYIPCRSPEDPAPGTCCPTCPGCKPEIRKGVQVPHLPMPLTDPCVTCMCMNDSMVCTKKACPVLPCPPSKFHMKPGSCCPECIGTRKVYKVDGPCMLGMQIFKQGDKMQYDSCTQCQCNDSTSLCQRKSCPPLDCWPEHQVKGEDCCPTCKAPEERKAVCMANGKIYQDRERWKMEKCTHCICRGGQVHCAVDPCEVVTSCPPRHTLKTLPGACCPTCVEDDGVCTIFGDPHYKTFDGHLYNYQGSCKYVLVKDCKNKSFLVEVLNDARYSKAFTWTKTVTIKVNGTKVRLGQNLKVHVNHKRVKVPYVQLGVLSVVQDGYNILVRTNIGVKLLWDGNSFLEVSVPSYFKGNLCGLCGNYNGNKEDDYYTKRGKLVSSIEEFGDSWRVGRMKRCSLTQPVQAESACQKNWDVRVRAIKECNVLKSPAFRPCHRVVSAAPYFRSCLVDACECRPRGKCYCESFMAYARECARAGVNLDWREATGCNGGRCSHGQQFMSCAPSCRRTCKKSRKHRVCGRCKPGCYCPPGTVWHRKQCIPLDQCPA